MVDTKKRKLLASALRKFSTGFISNDDFEDELIELFKGHSIIDYNEMNVDPVFKPVLQYCWCLYDDSFNYKLKGEHELTSYQLKEIARLILFLKSDQEYDWTYVDMINPVLRFSFTDILKSILSFGKHIKDKRLSRDEEFEQMKTEGNFEFWPFKTQIAFEKELKKQPFLSN